MGQKHHWRPASKNEGAVGVMLKKIIDRLSSQNLHGWQIRVVKKKSYQSFLAKEKRECERMVDTESYIVSVYDKREAPVFFDKSHGNGHSERPPSKNVKEVLGLSTFKIGPQNFPQLDTFLEEALFCAQLINNDPFDLPSQPQRLPKADILDNSIGPKTLSECEERLLQTVSKEKKIRLSSAEFFADRIHARLINHKGLDVEQEESVLQTEFVLLSKSQHKENEYISRYSRRLMEDFDIEAEVKQSAQFARDATIASLPKTGTFPVVFSDEPLDQIFNPIVARASARLKYNKMLDAKIGQSVLEEGDVKGDSVTLWSNGLLKGALGSNRFDSYGTATGRVCLVERNILKNYLADKRYADYLKLPVTGELGNIEVGEGQKKFNDMLVPSEWGEKTIYHLQAFSAFEPNAITGAFSAEIRAGYEISEKGVRPIKGGSVSGVLQKNLLDCYFSREITQRERAQLPKGLLFRQLTIAGE